MDFCFLIIFSLFFLSILIHNKFGSNFLYVIPVMNAIAEVTVYYFPKGSINTGYIRTLIIFLFIFIWIKNIKFNSSTKIIIIFLGYLLLLIPFSSNISNSFIIYLKIFISMMMLPIAYFIVRKIEDLKKLNSVIVLSTLIVIIQSIIAQIFRLGQSAYVTKTFYLGGGLVQLSYLLIVSLIISPLILLTTKRREKNIFIGFIFIISFIMMILYFRRTSYIAFAIGCLTYFLFTPKKHLIIKYIIIIAILFFVSFPLFKSTFFTQLERRSRVNLLIQKPLQREGRIIYTKIVFNEFLNKSIKHSLIGSELFNSLEYFEANRGLHTDYNILLHGSGAIGLLLYLLVIKRIITDFFRYKNQ